MKSISLVIIEETSPSEVLQNLKAFDFSNLNVSIIMLSHDANMEELKGQWQHDEKVHFHIIPFPEDEFFFKDLLPFIKSEQLCFFNPSYKYPTDYFQRTINQQTSDKDDDEQAVIRKGTLMERILRAAQQSKYGLGVLKKDIQRDFSKLKLSNIYQTADIKSGNILEQSLDEEIPQQLLQWADKAQVKSVTYHPDYKKIEYFQDLDSYISVVRQEAPKLKFKEKEDANGLPLYLLVLVWLGLVLAFFSPVGILIFLIFLAIYALVLSLEALAISTLKRQGELFIGLLFFLPLLHHIYLFTYISSLILGKKTD